MVGEYEPRLKQMPAGYYVNLEYKTSLRIRPSVSSEEWSVNFDPDLCVSMIHDALLHTFLIKSRTRPISQM